MRSRRQLSMCHTANRFPWDVVAPASLWALLNLVGTAASAERGEIEPEASILRVGYERVAVGCGGFQALMEDGVPMAPKAIAPGFELGGGA